MTLDDQLERAATHTRQTAAVRAARMAPPLRETGRRGPSKLGPIAAVGATAILLVGALSMLPSENPPEPLGQQPQAPAFVQDLDRPGYLTSESAGVEFWLPPGWNATTTTLTPDIDEWEPTAAYREADTIISMATYDLARPFTHITPGNCQHMPVNALAELAPSDALVTVLETSAEGLPDRPVLTGVYDGAPERFYPAIGEVNEDFCLDRVRQVGDADLFYREFIFSDAERSFIVRVALGSEATTELQRQTWFILDRLTFEPPAG